MITNKRVLMGMVGVLCLLLVMVSLVQPQETSLITIGVPTEVNQCEPYPYNVTITAEAKYPLNLTVTIPNGFIYNANSSQVNFSGSMQNIEPTQTANGTNLTWDFSNLASGVNVTHVSFNLTPGCGAESGRRLRALVYYNNSKTDSVNSASILVNEPFVTITINPEVADAHLNDTITYEIIVKNTGFSPAYNVSLNLTLTNLTLVNISTNSTSWSYALLNVSETRTETVNVTVAACDNQFMNVNMSRSCLGVVCQSSFAKGSIRFIPRIPFVKIIPQNVLVAYCQNTTVQVNLSNEGDSGAYDLYLRMVGLPSQYVSNPNATFYTSNNTFYIGDLPPNSSFNLTFDFGMRYGECTDPGSGTVAIFPTYYDECGNFWAPPVNLFRYAFNASSRPILTATKIADRAALYFGEEVNFTVSATYARGGCPENSILVNITDRYHEKLAIVDAGNGTVDATNHTITWLNVQLNDSVPWFTTLRFSANVSCGCGQTLANSLDVIAGTDCCNCPLNASAADSVIVECYNATLFTSSKTATPSPQEVCRNITYTTTYVFAHQLNWSDLRFMEAGNNSQTFPDGTFSGTAYFVVNSTCNESQTITLGQWQNLSFLSNCSNSISPGTTLEVKYTLKQNDDGTFPDWSYLNISGYPNTDCPDPGIYREAVFVSVDRPALSIAVDIADWITVCEEYNVTITATKSGVYPVYNVTIYYNDSLYRYIENTTIMSGFTNEQNVSINSFEPMRNGVILSWYLGNLSAGGTIQFRALKNCSLASTAMAWLDYQDNCDLSLGDVRHADDRDAPLIITKGDIIILKTPKVVFAKTKNVSWNIYVTNKGNGTAKNVTVVDVLDPDLRYVSSSIGGTPATPLVTTNNTTITWDLGDVDPNIKVTIGLNATFAGCEWLNNTVNASWGCCNESCQAVADYSRVEILEGNAVFVRHDAELIDECGGEANFTIIARNVGESYVYDVMLLETLPNCLEFVLDTNTSSPNATSFAYDVVNKTLGWYYNELAPGTTIRFDFKAVINQSCVCNESFGVAVAKINYTIPCGDFGQEDVKPFEPVKAEPQLSITKTPAFTIAGNSSYVNWTITVTSTGNYEAKNITLEDVLPSNTVFVSASPAVNTGNGSPSSPLIWTLANLSTGSSTVINVSAQVTGCADDTENTATVYWGCCVPKKNVSASAAVRTQPVLSLDWSKQLGTCGGNITLTIRNEGSTATITNITEHLPAGYRYLNNTATITSSNVSRAFTNAEPFVNATYLIWNSTNIDFIYPSETITIFFKVENELCEYLYCRPISPTTETFIVNYTDSCTIPLGMNETWAVNPIIITLNVTKEPETQTVGNATWWINISSTNGKAENVTVTDILGTAFMNIQAYYQNGTGDTTAGIDETNKTVTWTGQTVPEGTDTWVRRLRATVAPTGTLANNVTVDGHCLCGCIYSTTSRAVYASRLNFTKKPDDTLTIGEYANFTITAEYWGPEEYKNVTIRDSLPINLTYISSNITDEGKNSYNANLSFDNQTGITGLVWYLGNFTGPKVFTITLTTIVADYLGNQNGTLIWNWAQSVHQNENGSLFETSDSAWILVVEPDLQIAKVTNVTAPVQAGDYVNYTITVNHTAASAVDAYDVWINDTIPSGLSYVSNTSAPPANIAQHTGQQVSWFYQTIARGATVVINYTVQVDADVVATQPLVNRANLSWTSTNGTNPYERFGNWTDLDDYNRTITAPLTVSNRTAISKWPDYPRNYTIGEEINFTIFVDLDRAVYRNVSIRDHYLSNLTYNHSSFQLIANNASFNYLVTKINSTVDQVTWNLGDVNNSDNKDITITFNLTVTNHIETQDGDNFTNWVWFRYSNYTNVTQPEIGDSSGLITIKEPDLQIKKVHNITDTVEYCDNITYTIVVNHTASSHWPAYDVWINETIPNGLTYLSNYSVPSADTFNRDGQRVAWYYQEIPLGASVLINYTVHVASNVQMNQSLLNRVNLTWTSTNGTNPNERFGNWTDLDDYNRTDEAPVRVNDTVTIAKTPDYDRNATIGSSMNYTIVIDLPRATAHNVTVNDTLPQGLIYDPSSFFLTANNDSFSESVSSPNDGTAPVYITWSLGTVNNSDDTDITITFSAIVADVSANQNGTVLAANNVSVFWRDANNTLHTQSDQSGTIKILEPDLELAKQANETLVEAGQTFNYTIRVQHTAASAWDAYDVWINDTLPDALAIVANSSTPLANATFESGNAIGWFYNHIPQATEVVINYTVLVTDTVVINETLLNLVNLTWTSTNGTNPNERFGNWTDLDDYNRTDEAPVRVNDTVTIAKTPDYDRNATIGSSMNYTIVIDLPRATAHNVTVNDTLPQGLIYDPSSFFLTANNDSFSESVSSPNNGTTEVYVNWSLGTVNNSDDTDITINFSAIVADVPANQNGTELVANLVYVTLRDVNNRWITQSDQSGTIKILEPDLEVLKAATETLVEAGQTFNYTIRVQHTAASAWDAYDVWINDTLPDALAIVANTSAPPANATFEAGNAIGWFYNHIPLGTEVVINYTVLVTDTVVINETLLNNATLTWTSTNGTNPNERFGNWTDLDDYNRTDEAPVRVNDTVTISKEVNKATAAIGEYLNYTLIIDLPRAHLLNLTVVDTLQQGLIYLSHTASEPDSPTISTPNNGTQPVTLTFSYAAFNNSAGNDLSFNITAFVANHPSNQNGTVLKNTLNVSWTDAGGADHRAETEVLITVVEPKLEITKTSNVSSVQAGDLLPFTIIIEHAANSSADAYDLWLNDTIPLRTEFINYSSSPVEDNFTQLDNRNLSWFYAYLPLGQTVNLTYTVRVNESVSPLDILKNNATLVWTSVNESIGNESEERFGEGTELNDYNTTATQNVTITAAELIKLPEYDRTHWINDTVWYQLSIILPHARIINLTVNDTVPAGLIFRTTSVVVAPPHNYTLNVSAPNDGTQPVNLSFVFGTIQDGHVLNISFNARVADILQNQNGTIIGPNYATVRWQDNEGTVHNDSASSGNVTVIRLPRLNTSDSVRKIVEPNWVPPGGLVNYTVFIKNTGFAPAFNVTLSDTLPQNVSYIAGTTVMNGASGPDPNSIVPGANGTTKLTWIDLIPRINASETVWVRYTCNVSLDAPLRTVLVNNATVEKYEDEEGNEYPGASDSAKLTVRYPMQVPAMSSYSLWLLAGVLALVAISTLRRRARRGR